MPLKRKDALREVPARTSLAVAHYWQTRAAQKDKQTHIGKLDQGLRSAVSGGRKWMASSSCLPI